jgi:acyl-CoA synthetase (AMP-forming)/AMP-acid ligase II
VNTVDGIVRWRARQHPERVAIHFEGRTTSYDDLNRESNVVANALLRAGLTAGQRVCVLDQGHDRVFELIFGITKAGGAFTPINWRLTPPEIAFVLSDAEAGFLFVGESFGKVIEEMAVEPNGLCVQPKRSA